MTVINLGLHDDLWFTRGSQTYIIRWKPHTDPGSQPILQISKQTQSGYETCPGHRAINNWPQTQCCSPHRTLIRNSALFQV